MEFVVGGEYLVWFSYVVCYEVVDYDVDVFVFMGECDVVFVEGGLFGIEFCDYILVGSFFVVGCVVDLFSEEEVLDGFCF